MCYSILYVAAECRFGRNRHCMGRAHRGFGALRHPARHIGKDIRFAILDARRKRRLH